MPATALTIQTVLESGTVMVAPVTSDSSNGNSFTNTGKQIIEATETAAASATFTVAFGYTVRGQTIPAKSYSVAASGEKRAGPFDPAIYGTTLIVTPSANTLKLRITQTA